MSRAVRSTRNLQYSRLLLIVPLILVGLLYFSRAYGVDLLRRSVTMSDSQTSAVTIYKVAFDLPGSETLGSIKIEFCSDTPFVGAPCTPPTGLDLSGAALSSQVGETGFSILGSATTANSIVLTRSASATTATSVSYELANIVNPSVEGTFYGRLQTFASTDATSSENERGGLALSVNAPIQISTYVPPYLLFCVGVTISGFDCANASGDYVNFGNLSSSSTSSGTTQMLTATNAGNGFNITVNGNTMISGTNVIPGIAAPDVSRPGTAQFGTNLVGNTSPTVGADPIGGGNATPAAGYDTPNFYKFAPGDIIATDTDTDAYRLFTNSYIVNIPKGQAVGVYVATLTYICLANF